MTPADLLDALEFQLGRVVGDVGLLLDGPSGTTRAFHGGLRVGLAAVGIRTVDPLPIAPLVQADVANLSADATLRVLQEAERSVLRRVLSRWDVAEQAGGAPEFAPAEGDVARGGWRRDQHDRIVAALAILDRDLARPYREPGPALLVNPPAQNYIGGPSCVSWRQA